MSKELRVEKVEASTLVRIAWTGGGEVPDDLKGFFTSRVEAERAIARWKSANPQKEDVVVQKAAPVVDSDAPKSKKGMSYDAL